MTPILTDAEIAELLPILREQASWHGRRFDHWKMNTDDLMQQGLLGILTMKTDGFNTAAHRLSCRILAAKHEMIDGIRAFHSNRPRHRKQIEWLMPDYDHLAKYTLVDEDFEDRTIAAIDRQRLAARIPRMMEQLEGREQAVLYARLRGQTLLELADTLQLTEGRLCQIEKQIVTKLREQYQEAA